MFYKQKHSFCLVDPEFQWKQSKNHSFPCWTLDFIFIGPFCDPVLQSMILEFTGSHINGSVGDGAALSGLLWEDAASCRLLFWLAIVFSIRGERGQFILRATDVTKWFYKPRRYSVPSIALLLPCSMAYISESSHFTYTHPNTVNNQHHTFINLTLTTISV